MSRRALTMRKAAIWEGRAVSFAPNQWMSFGMLRCCMNSAVDRSRLEFHASKLHVATSVQTLSSVWR